MWIRVRQVERGGKQDAGSKVGQGGVVRGGGCRGAYH